MSSHGPGVEGGPSTLVRGEGNSRDVLTVQREEPETHFAAVDAVRHDTQRRIIWALATQNGRVSYQDLDEVTTTSERTVRKHASNLVDAGLIERTNANFVFFEFATPSAEILTREALSRWYDLTES